jgi:hypothetical protein
MRKLVIAGSACAILLVVAAVAYAQGTTANTLMSATVGITPKDSGTKKKPKGSKASINIKQTTKDGTGQPATSVRIDVDLPQEVTLKNLKKAKKGQQCDSKKADQAKNDNVCPKAAKVGEGHVTSKGSNGAITEELDLTAYIIKRGRTPGLGMWLKSTPSAPVSIRQFLPGKVNHRKRLLSFSIPPNVQTPVPGIDTAIEVLRFSLGGKVLKAGPLMQTTGCKTGKRSTKIISFSKDGGKVIDAAVGRCTK